MGIPQPLSQRLPPRMTSDAVQRRGAGGGVGNSAAVSRLEGFVESSVRCRREGCGGEGGTPRSGQKVAARRRMNSAEVIDEEVDRADLEGRDERGNVGVDLVTRQNVLVAHHTKRNVVLAGVVVVEDTNIGARQKTNGPSGRNVIPHNNSCRRTAAKAAQVEQHEGQPMVQPRGAGQVETSIVDGKELALEERQAAARGTATGPPDGRQKLNDGSRLHRAGQGSVAGEFEVVGLAAMPMLDSSQTDGDGGGGVCQVVVHVVNVGRNEGGRSGQRMKNPSAEGEGEELADAMVI